MSKQQIGVIGLAVMGKNLALNIESRDFLFLFTTDQAVKLRSFYRRQKEKMLLALTALKNLSNPWKHRAKSY